MENRAWSDLSYTRGKKLFIDDDDTIDQTTDMIHIDDLNELEQLNSTTGEPDILSQLFLLDYLPKLPTPDDQRYKNISQYGSKTYAFGMERNRCLEFEILARDKNNVQAIEEAIQFYDLNSNIIDSYSEHQKNMKLVALAENADVPEDDQETKTYKILRDKLQSLRLLPFKNYHKSEQFEHWAINPKIYTLMNIYNPEQLFSHYKMIPLHENPKDTRDRTYQLDGKGASFFVSEKPLNEHAIFHTSTPIHAKFIDTTTGNFNKKAIMHRIVAQHIYPQKREHSKLYIEIDMTMNTQAIKDYVNAVIKEVFDKAVTPETQTYTGSIPISPDSDEMQTVKIPAPANLLEFNTFQAKGTKIEEKFFVYDYYHYRQEQMRHNKMAEEQNDFYAQDIIKNEENDDIISARYSSTVYEEIRSKVTPLIKSKSETLSDDSIIAYIKEISAFIQRSQETPDFLEKQVPLDF